MKKHTIKKQDLFLHIVGACLASYSFGILLNKADFDFIERSVPVFIFVIYTFLKAHGYKWYITYWFWALAMFSVSVLYSFLN